MIEAVAGRIDITPRAMTPLWGFAAREGKFEGIADRLEANVVLLRDQGRLYVLATFDLLYVGRRVTRAVEGYLAGLGIAAAGIFLTASHTHFAPAADDTKLGLGNVDDDYVEALIERILGLLSDLLGRRFEPVRVLASQATSDPLTINRRLLRRWPRLGRRGLELRPVLLAPNPEGPRDSTIDVLSFETADGRPLALAWSYACHPVCFTPWRRVSAEFPGVVRVALRSKFSAGLPVLFWQGFSGDVRPALGLERSVCGRCFDLVCGKRFAGASIRDWSAWANTLAGAVVKAYRSAKTAVGGPIQARAAARPLADLIDGKPTNRAFDVRCFSLSERFHVVFASAEMMVEHKAMIDPRGGRVLCIGCTGDVFGYFPTTRQVAEGGYEAAEFLPYFGFEGRFRKNPDAMWCDMVNELGLCAVSHSAAGAGGAGTATSPQ